MLEIVRKTVRYGAVTALDDVTFRVAAGERVAIVGPNGAGKSTLLRELAGGGNRAVLVPQQMPDAPGLTAREFVMLGRAAHLSPWRRPSAADEEAVRAALRAVDAAFLAERRLDEVSGGERRRLAVALALASEAPALLLDEPAAQLDFVHRAELQTLLKTLPRTLVMTVHELPFASGCFTRVALMAEGRIVADGEPAAVLTADNLSRAWGVSVAVAPAPAAFML
ncbi:MAG: ABC transporter ATP-binding protein [Kiritimatiellia bacterium]